MKIVFICGSLDPGRDGVGDYTRKLAAELIRKGHRIRGISLNEHNICEESVIAQHIEGIDIEVLRIPSTWQKQARFKIAKEWINIFNPEWLSLQFVPFSFDIKGLPIFLAKDLANLGKGIKWHIMFHELWVGDEPKNNWKRFIYSKLQKYLIISLIKHIKPSSIHTHLPVFYNQLCLIGCEVRVLPLFSAISLEATDNINFTKNIFRIGIFSQIEANDATIEFISKLTDEVKNCGQVIEILLIGGNKFNMLKFRDEIERLSNFKGKITYTGFLESKAVSFAIQSCTIGLTSFPLHSLGKSSSVAAFISHGVPVAAPNVSPYHGANEIGFFSSFLKSAIILTPNIVSLEHYRKAALLAIDHISLASIADKYLLDLHES